MEEILIGDAFNFRRDDQRVPQPAGLHLCRSVLRLHRVTRCRHTRRSHPRPLRWA